MMIRPFTFVALLALLTAGCGEKAPADSRSAANTASADVSATASRPPPTVEADVVKVRLETEAGPIVLALDHKRAPVTTKNFLAYVDQQRFDGTSFYRAARTPGASNRGFIQGGIHRDYRRVLNPIAHEPTSETGLRHKAGTISMARGEPGSATGEFFITASDIPKMDARGAEPGFAAFGRVSEGMDVVRKILAAPTIPRAGRGPMKGQMIEKPVKIVSVRRME